MTNELTNDRSEQRAPGRSRPGSVQLVLLALAGSVVTLALLGTEPGRRLAGRGSISLDFAAKLATQPARSAPIFYTRPTLPVEPGVRRRGGPHTVYGNVLADFARFMGEPGEPYRELAPVRISYGPLGFRDELPARPGGIAVVGSSYVEAGFAAVADTIPGQLTNVHGRAASNFGVSNADGVAMLAYLRRFVLPTKPSAVVWVVSERFDLRPRPVYEVSFREFVPGNGLDLVKAFGRAWSRSLRSAFDAPPIARLEDDRAEATRCRFRPTGALVDVYPAPDSLGVAMGAFLWQARAALDLCRAADAKFLVVLVPARPRFLAPELEAPDGGSVAWKLSQDYDNIIRSLKGKGVHAVDLTPALAACVARGELPVVPIVDQHLNALGMSVVASETAAALERLWGPR